MRRPRNRNDKTRGEPVTIVIFIFCMNEIKKNIWINSSFCCIFSNLARSRFHSLNVRWASMQLSGDKTKNI